MLTEKELSLLSDFKLDEEGNYCDWSEYSICPTNNARTSWNFCLFCEVDGSLTFVKRLTDLADLKRLYTAMTEGMELGFYCKNSSDYILSKEGIAKFEEINDEIVDRGPKISKYFYKYYKEFTEKYLYELNIDDIKSQINSEMLNQKGVENWIKSRNIDLQSFLGCEIEEVMKYCRNNKTMKELKEYADELRLKRKSRKIEKDYFLCWTNDEAKYLKENNFEINQFYINEDSFISFYYNEDIGVEHYISRESKGGKNFVEVFHKGEDIESKYFNTLEDAVNFIRNYKISGYL